MLDSRILAVGLVVLVGGFGALPFSAQATIQQPNPVTRAADQPMLRVGRVLVKPEASAAMLEAVVVSEQARLRLLRELDLEDSKLEQQVREAREKGPAPTLRARIRDKQRDLKARRAEILKATNSYWPSILECSPGTIGRPVRGSFRIVSIVDASTFVVAIERERPPPEFPHVPSGRTVRNPFAYVSAPEISPWIDLEPFCLVRLLGRGGLNVEGDRLAVPDTLAVKIVPLERPFVHKRPKEPDSEITMALEVIDPTDVVVRIPPRANESAVVVPLNEVDPPAVQDPPRR